MGLGLMALVAVGCGATPGATGGTVMVDTTSSVTFRNQSSYDLYRIFLSPSSQSTWGPDQLGANILRTGADYTLTGIPCDTYDLRLVDEDGDECVVQGANICAEASGIVINNDNLLACEGWR
jgi:hypothetical protein